MRYGQIPLQIVSGGGSVIVSKPVNKPNKAARKFERHYDTFTSILHRYSHSVFYPHRTNIETVLKIFAVEGVLPSHSGWSAWGTLTQRDEASLISYCPEP